VKTFQQFQQDLKEFAPALLAPYVLPAAAAALGAAGLIHQARKQGEGKRSQPVDYGQGGTATPRTPNVQRPSAKITAAENQRRQALEDRRAQARERADAKAQQRIDDLIGSDAERKAAAQARANQPQIQQGLRRQATRNRMNQAADRLGLPEQIAPGKPMLPNARDQVIVDPQSPGQKLRNLQLKVKYYGGYPPKGPV
jgi:Spy/CpxP family protein refolding chaperone